MNLGIRKESAVEWINRELSDKQSELMDEYRKLNVEISKLTKDREEISKHLHEIDVTVAAIKIKSNINKK